MGKEYKVVVKMFSTKPGVNVPVACLGQTSGSERVVFIKLVYMFQFVVNSTLYDPGLRQEQCMRRVLWRYAYLSVHSRRYLSLNQKVNKNE